MKSVLCSLLLVWAPLFGALAQASGDDLPAPHWAVDPDNPGPLQPEVGRSLFDVLFAKGGEQPPEHEISYPFSALLESIQAHLDPEEPPVRVLIPRGRSLQREAAAPLYFRHPRVVIAVDGEPRRRPGYADIFLKSQIFLGYQEKANTIEVISYNDEAARFEFQKVLDYGEGLEPYVVNAERAVCISCHQNAGPIFPEAPWSETDAKLRISTLIHALRPEYYDQPLFSLGSQSTWAVDYATDRANYFASYQLLWQRACGDETPLREESVRCRAAVLEAIIKFRLNGAWYVDHQSPRFREAVVDVVSRRWNELWPGGIYVPTADLPDRDPFVESAVEGKLDPVYRRAPRAYWTQPDARILVGFVIRLSEFLSRNDVKRIDDDLQALAQTEEIPRQRLGGTCRLRFNEHNPARADIECQAESPSMFGLTGWVELANDKAMKGKLNSVQIGGEEETLGVELEDTHVDFLPQAGRMTISFLQTKKLNPRRRNGDLIERLELNWDPAQTDDGISADATLTIASDFSLVSRAIERLIDETMIGTTDALAIRPFRRHSVLQALYHALGMPSLTWCC